MFQSSGFLDQVDLILKNDDILEFHDLYSGQMFGGLGLRTGFVTSDEEECSVHDCSSVKHCSHENVVSRTVNKGDMADELHTGVAAGALAGRVVLLVGTVGPIAPWSRAGLVFALVNLYVGVRVDVMS